MTFFSIRPHTSSPSNMSSSSSSVKSSRPITTNAVAGQQHRSDSAYTPSVCSSTTSSSSGAQQRGRHSRASHGDCGENGLAATGQGGGDAGQERTMGLISAILMIVGTLIGTGIFASPGPLFDSVHCTQTSFIIWAFAGIVCTIGAFAYAELGTMFPASGGDFQYLRRAYGKKVAWVFGWSFITILNPIGTAGIAGVMGRYSVDLIAYSRTGNSIGASSVARGVSAAGSAAGATSAAQDAILNTLGRMMWTSINGTAAVWAAGAGAGPSGTGTGAGANMSPNPALNTGNAPFLNAPHATPVLPPNQQQDADAMPWLVRGFSIGAIVLMGLINIFFKEGGKYASNLLAIFKIAGMCMLIVIGSMQAVKNHAQSEALQIPINESSQNVLDYVSALCFAFFAYNGFNNINLGLGELRDPERNLKRAVFIAMPFVTILFLLANFAFFSILSSYDLRHVHSLSLHAGHTVLGQPGGFLMAGTVVASALGSINANIWAGSRLLVIMAKDNTVIPFPIARVWNRTGTQAIAILILVGQASFHSLINLDFKTFSKIYSAVGWTWYGLSVAGLLYLRKKRPNYPRPVKVFWPLAAFFVVIAAVLVVGSLTLAFMSSAVQKAGSGDGGEDGDVATGGGADGSGDAGEGKYVSIIMFGMVILFMTGVIPAFYLTKRYNQEHSSAHDNKTTTCSATSTTDESAPDNDGGSEEGHHRNRRMGGGGGVAGAGKMIQIQRPAPLHQTAITIDFDHTHTDIHDNNLHFHPNNTDPTSLTTGGVGSIFGAFSPETLQDGRPARRHSAASSVTLVGEASKKRKNKQRRPKSKEGSKPTHHHGHHEHRHREHGPQGGGPSRSQSLDPIVPAHCPDNRKQDDNVVDEEEEEVARVQALCNSLSGGSGVAGDVTRYLSLENVELGTRSLPGTTSSSTPSRTVSSNGSTNTSDDSDSDVDFTSTPDSDEEDEEDEIYNGTTRPTIYTHNRPSHLFFPFDPSSAPSHSSSRPEICTSPTMLSPFGSRTQTAFNSPLIDSTSPTFATAGGPGPRGSYLTCGFNTRSGSHSSETTLGLDGDFHHEQEEEQGEASELEDVKGKGGRTRQSSTCERVDEVAEEEYIDGSSQAGRSNENDNNNTTTTTHYGSYLTDFHNNNNNSNGHRRDDDSDDDERAHP